MEEHRNIKLNGRYLILLSWIILRIFLSYNYCNLQPGFVSAKTRNRVVRPGGQVDEFCLAVSYIKCNLGRYIELFLPCQRS